MYFLEERLSLKFPFVDKAYRRRYNFTMVLFIAIVLFFQSCSLTFAKDTAQKLSSQLPEEGIQLLQSIPEKKLTVPFLIKRSVATAESFKSLEAFKINASSTELLYRTAFDPVVTLSGTTINDQNEPATGFQAVRTIGTTTSIGLSKAFSTGTSVSVEAKHGRTDINFPSLGNQAPYYETTGSLTLSQDLLKNAFGTSARNNLRAGELTTLSNQSLYESSVENWMIDIISLFYQSWLAQSQANVARENLKRRERLLKITKVKARRGTSEKPDVLQVESAHLQAEIDFKKALERLAQIWRNLAIGLKLPSVLIEVDPRLVPLKLDDPIQEAENACGPEQNLKEAPETSVQLKRLDFAHQAAEHLFTAAKSDALPDLKLALSYETNGVESSNASVSEAFQFQHPAWSASLNLSIPLLNSSAKSNIQTVLAQKVRAESEFSSAKDQILVDWKNNCNDYYRNREARTSLRNAFKKEKERLKLEEQRFKIGRNTPLAVIQAGDDASRVELSLHQSEVSLRIAAWKVIQLATGLKGHLKKFVGTRE